MYAVVVGSVLSGQVVDKYGRSDSQNGHKTEVLGHIAVVVVKIILVAALAVFCIGQGLRIGCKGKFGAHYEVGCAYQAHFNTVVVVVFAIIVGVSRRT